MIKSELVRRIVDIHQYMHFKDAERIVDIVFDNIIGALVNNRRVELRGFGSFAVRQRKARIGRNPRTGEKVTVQAKKVPFFKAGRQLLDYINEVSRK